MSDSARAATSGGGSPEDGGASAARGRQQPERLGLFARIALFLRQVVAELKKVVQPTRAELIRYTIVVLVFVGIVMAFVTVLDLGIGTLVGWVFGG